MFFFLIFCSYKEQLKVKVRLYDNLDVFLLIKKSKFFPNNSVNLFFLDYKLKKYIKNNIFLLNTRLEFYKII